MRPVIKVSGIDKCIGFGDVVCSNVSQVIEKEAERGSQEIKKRERSLAPVKSGQLRKSIVTRKGKYGISRMVRAKAPHAPLQEYGTRRGVKGRHFAEKTRQELVPVIEARLRAAVQKAVKR